MLKTFNKTSITIAATLSCLMLSGCSGFGVASASAQAVYNRHNLQQSFTNHEIAASISSKVTDPKTFADCYIDVSTFHNQVLLTGSAANNALRDKAANIAAYTPNVEHVYNFIYVGPIPSHGRIAEDSWITTKIKTKIIAGAQMDPGSVKVVTDNGVVYLMGFVTAKQAKIATSIAQHTNGVTKVVRIFEYINLSSHPIAK